MQGEQMNTILAVGQFQVVQQLIHEFTVRIDKAIQPTQIEYLRVVGLIRRCAGKLLGQPCLQIHQADRFEQAIVHARLLAADLFLPLRIGGKPEDQRRRQALSALFVAYRTCQFVPAERWHVAVGNHQVELMLKP
ncbi:hypothetical protein D3C80_1354280 [compost metagenome]